jgi:Stress responsive A/B Barrel Domain
MLIHSVYFWLQPGLTAAQRAEFRRGVESLAAIKSVERVHVGTPAGVPDRPVVDKTFDFGLTVVCRDVAAHDAYQADPIHRAFVARFSSDWTRVQIFDAA